MTGSQVATVAQVHGLMAQVERLNATVEHLAAKREPQLVDPEARMSLSEKGEAILKHGVVLHPLCKRTLRDAFHSQMKVQREISEFRST